MLRNGTTYNQRADLRLSVLQMTGESAWSVVIGHIISHDVVAPVLPTGMAFWREENVWNQDGSVYINVTAFGITTSAGNWWLFTF